MQHIRHTAFSLTLSTLTALAASITAAELPSPCETPRMLLAQDQVRQGEGLVGEAHCYRLDLTSPGLLQLDVAIAGALPSGAKVDVVAAGEPGAKPIRMRTFGRSATERLSMAGDGAWYVEVSAEDPRRPLPAYRLSSRFVEIAKSETNGETEIEPEKSETNGETEIELEKGLLERPFVCGVVSLSETNGETEIEPEKSETNGETEIEPEKSTAINCGRILPLVDLLCRAGENDDHGDTLACATPLGRRAFGEIDNGWGDDADVFRFEVRRWQTVEITTAGGLDTHGTLLDAAGQRLAADDDQDENGGFRIVRTLGPGTYFVRVEGVGSAGAYDLLVSELGR